MRCDRRSGVRSMTTILRRAAWSFAWSTFGALGSIRHERRGLRRGSVGRRVAGRRIRDSSRLSEVSLSVRVGDVVSSVSTLSRGVHLDARRSARTSPSLVFICLRLVAGVSPRRCRRRRAPRIRPQVTADARARPCRACLTKMHFFTFTTAHAHICLQVSPRICVFSLAYHIIASLKHHQASTHLHREHRLGPRHHIIIMRGVSGHSARRHDTTVAVAHMAM